MKYFAKPQNQEGAAHLVLVIVAVLLLVAGSGYFVWNSKKTDKSSKTDSSVKVSPNAVAGTILESFEGTITSINHPNGACLTYVVDKTKNVAAECPGMSGVEGFTGEYDKNAKVGDKVSVKGHLRLKSADHTTYHLEKSGTYLRLAN